MLLTYCEETNKLNFLIVDDSNSMRKIISRTIKEMGCNAIVEAPDGRKALDAMQDNDIDFIVCDWNMPGMKGIDVLREIRTMAEYKDIPFLMVSAESKTENVFEAIQSGVSNYLPKPFTSEILKKKIEAILNSKKKVKLQ